MANVTTGNVWKIDTTGSVRTNPLYVHRMWWTPSASGDDIDIQDAGGNSVWSYKAVAGTTDLTISIDAPWQPGTMNGINVVTLDGGELYIQIN